MRWWALMLLACDGGAMAPPIAPDPVASQSTPEATPRAIPSLTIATWNTKRLGHGDKDLDSVAGVLRQFDVVAVQEVMDREVIESLLGRMPAHRALLTDTPVPREGSYREYYTFFYRPDRLDPSLNTFVPDSRDAFVRDPYLACFWVTATAGKLCLITVHIVFGDGVAGRKAEILALDDVLRWAQEGDETAWWVVLGDFNRPVDDGDRDTEPEAEWRELLDRRQLRAPVVLAGTEVPTTLGEDGYRNAYDHIFVSDALAGHVVEAGRVDIVEDLCAGSFERCRSMVSDHAPVFVEIRVPPT